MSTRSGLLSSILLVKTGHFIYPRGRGARMASRAAAPARAKYIAELGAVESHAGAAMLDYVFSEFPDDDARRAPDYFAIKHIRDLLAGKKGADAHKHGWNVVHFLEERASPGGDVLSLKPPVGENLHAALSAEPGIMAWCDGCRHRHPLLAWKKCWAVPDGGEQGNWTFFYICTTQVKVHKVDLSVHFC